MIKLAKICQTCAYANFQRGYNSGECKYWRDNAGYTVKVCKPFTCEHWKDAQDGEKEWPWISPKQRCVHWKKWLIELNEFIYGKKTKDHKSV